MLRVKKRFISKITSNIRLSVLMLSVGLSGTALAEKTSEGPDSVPKFHPLCLPILKDWQEEGGALDMKKCAYEQRRVKVSKTAEGAYFAKKPESKNGYIAYKPIGTLDKAIELLLVFNKEDKNPISSIYFLGRIPGSELTRDYLTTIEDGGDRCFSGVRDARLVSESELEVDINATVNNILTFLDEGETGNTANLSLNPNNYQKFACAGTITKTYNLISNEVSFSRVSFAHDASRKVVNKNARCFEKYISEHIEPPRVLNMDEYRAFLLDYQQHCTI